MAGQSSDLSSGFRCLGLETITSTCFGKSIDCFSNEDFHSLVLEAMETIVTWFMAFKHFVIVRKTILNVPEELALKLFPKGISFAQMRNVRSNDRRVPKNTLLNDVQMFAE